MPTFEEPGRSPQEAALGVPETPATVTSTASGPECAICMGGLRDGVTLDPCSHSICQSCFATWAQTCRCAIPGVPPECVHCSSGKVECPFCRELTTHPASSQNDQRRRKADRDQRHALRRARERHREEQARNARERRTFTIAKNPEGAIGVRFRGIEIIEVVPGAPADTAGLTAGMAILKIGREAVQDHSDAVHAALCSAPPTFSVTVAMPATAELAAADATNGTTGTAASSANTANRPPVPVRSQPAITNPSSAPVPSGGAVTNGGRSAPAIGSQGQREEAGRRPAGGIEALLAEREREREKERERERERERRHRERAAGYAGAAPRDPAQQQQQQQHRQREDREAARERKDAKTREAETRNNVPPEHRLNDITRHHRNQAHAAPQQQHKHEADRKRDQERAERNQRLARYGLNPTQAPAAHEDRHRPNRAPDREPLPASRPAPDKPDGKPQQHQHQHHHHHHHHPNRAAGARVERPPANNHKREWDRIRPGHDKLEHRHAGPRLAPTYNYPAVDRNPALFMP